MGHSVNLASHKVSGLQNVDELCLPKCRQDQLV